ncbi:pseudouridylate synthase [Chitinophaga ginsengisegetis]|uniref:pseudouridylate synthase n=1 Tax=Chitinophaga ginsengisegetis TaxID=393003 RepID=UPI003428B89B
MDSVVYEPSVFSPFDESTAVNELAAGLTFSLNGAPHPLCLLAAGHLQAHLQQQQEWEHNFGLPGNAAGTIIGKMFGVLIVRTKDNKLGYLAAFSGKLAGGNHHAKFVPPIFDGLEPGGFVNTGMLKLTAINEEIGILEAFDDDASAEQVRLLKILRKNHSTALQHKIFEQYHFLNKAGTSKSLIEIFEHTPSGKPPAGAGECAAPKLLQYAFRHEMEPLALAEFWWGQSPKSDYWQHGHFYAPCREKCAAILAHMLGE